jgi:hypothetical protein
VALDTVKTPLGSLHEGLGGSATYFSAAARFYSPVAIAAVVIATIAQVNEVSAVSVGITHKLPKQPMLKM